MNKPQNNKSNNLKPISNVPTVSGVFDSGEIIEMVYDSKEKRTSLVVWVNDKWSMEKSYKLDSGHCLVPYSPYNNLIKNEIVGLPSEPEEYISEESLINDIQEFIHKYVDISPEFEKIASYYVLFSWIYDGFNELPYLRLRGDYGSGKTRFLLTVGSLCYKPIFASGASTVSPIFHILEAFRGTLIIDEADFRFSDETADMVKILNNGNVKGFPVLRIEINQQKEFNPKAFNVFGPKLVATRGYYKDRALESRFISEEMGQNKLREDIPINLPSEYKEEALHIRNKLLLFRFRNLGKIDAETEMLDRSIEPRLNQIFTPLMSVIDNEQTKDQLRKTAHHYNNEMIIDRGMDMEAQVLEVIYELSSSPDKIRFSIKDITSLFTDRYGFEYDRKITAKWVGNIIRKKLKLLTQKSNGVFIIAPTEKLKLDRLYERYGINTDKAIHPDSRQTNR